MIRIPMTPKCLKRLQEALKQEEEGMHEAIRDMEASRNSVTARENAPFHAANARHAQHVARRDYLASRIRLANVIDPESIDNNDKIMFGATVTVVEGEDEALGKATPKVFCIVGEDETDDAFKISITSPVARALLNKRVGDEVRVSTPGLDREFTIIRIEYKAIP